MIVLGRFVRVEEMDGRVLSDCAAAGAGVVFPKEENEEEEEEGKVLRDPYE
jgi:hypothetical protein